MLNSITISNFKAITEPLTLNDLASVNYLVGKNGCGKSSVLEAIHLRLNNLSNIEKVEGIPLKYRFLGTTLPGVFETNRKENTSIELTLSNGTPKDYNVLYLSNDNIIISANETSSFSDKYLEVMLDCTYSWLLKEKYLEYSILKYIQLFDVEDGGGGFEPSTEYHEQALWLCKYSKKRYSNIEFFKENEVSNGERRLYNLKRFLQICNPYASIYHKSHHGYSVGFSGNLIICIDEPELGLHPSWQKILSDIINESYETLNENFGENSVQFFISTHSNYLISEALKLPYQKVYHFDDVGVVKNPEGINSLEIKSFNNVLDSLGSKPSDMLFANGIIWVEGPADVIYIQKWLEMYGFENNKQIFEKGIHYEFAMYGGALLTYMYGENKTKKEDLQNIFKINTRAFVICDSDKKDEFGEDVSTYTEAKKEIELAVGIENFWCDEQVKTIENYLIKEKEDTWKYRTNCSFEITDEKPKKAFLRIEHWKKKNIKLNNFATTLLPNIEKLYKVIESWNK